MSNGQPQSEHDRIRELEARVETLTRELERMRAERRASGVRGRRIGDPQPKPSRPASRVWTLRVLMLLLAAAIGVATWSTLSAQNASLASIARGEGLQVDWTLVVAAVLGLFSIAVHRQRPQGFILLGLVAGYAVFALYLVRPEAVMPISERSYAWLAFGLLTIWHLLVSALCVMESRRIGRGRRRAALLATLNCAAYYPLVWYGLRTYGSTNETFIYSVLAVLAVFLAIFAESSGPHRNYLFHIFLAASILLLNIAMYKALDGPWLIAALSLECLGLAGLFHISGIVVLKPVNLLVLLATFIVTMQAMKFTGPMYIGSQTIHSNWIQGMFTAAVMLCTSWYYARHIRSVKPPQRRLSGHWFLADTAFDVPSSTVSLLHAAGASLLITLLVISDLGNLPSLPFLLALFSAGVAVLGFALRTPQIETGAVMLVVAAHVSFYFLLYIQKEGFTEQPRFDLYTLLLAAYTFVGGFRGERFLARISGGQSSEYHASAALPYIIATGSTAAIVFRYAGISYAPIAMAALALLLAVIGFAARATGLKLSAVTSLGIGTGFWLFALFQANPALTEHTWLWPMYFAQVLACIIVERSFAFRAENGQSTSPTERAAQFIVLVVAGALGTCTFALAAPVSWQTVLVFAHAFAWIAICVLVSDAHYRWTALLMLVASAALLAYRQRVSQPDASITMVLTAAIVMLIVLCAIWFVLPPRTHSGSGQRLATHK